MKDVIGVSFEDSKIYYFESNGLKVKPGITVIVMTQHGQRFGTVKIPHKQIEEKKLSSPLKKAIRISSKKDFQQYKKNKKDAYYAKKTCQEIADDYNLDMKVIDASFTFDRDKLIFRFLADGRVDFRQLAKDLAHIYRVRIELRQIGVRDKAKEIGGYGPCGRKLCCSSFLKDIGNVNINMAKNQSIALNPTKINGVCGRLMCCLKYEDECYTKCKEHMKKIGDEIDTPFGKGTVQSLDILRQKYRVEVPNHGVIEVDKI